MAMSRQTPERPGGRKNGFAENGDAFLLTRRIVNQANQGIPRVDFLREASALLLEFCRCDCVELWLVEDSKCTRCRARNQPAGFFEYKNIPCFLVGEKVDASISENMTNLDWLGRDVMLGRFDSTLPFFTKRGSFFTGNLEAALSIWWTHCHRDEKVTRRTSEVMQSVAIIPLVFIRDNIGLLVLKSNARDFFTKEKVQGYQSLARDLGFALVNQKAQAALRERVKEQTCLYGIAQLAATPDITVKQILQGIVELLPPGWQYPEITAARITFDGDEYTSPGFVDIGDKQSARIIVNGQYRGLIEVVYREKMPELDEGPFLKEERKLIDVIAREVALIVEQKLAAEEQARLQGQLIHADRLATIGQLAAGVAHELNEPLGNILGFAQLAEKHPGTSPQVIEDVEKIVKASLHAREVVKKLLLFARQTPPKKQPVNLNHLVADGLYFLESRCAKASIKLVRDLAEGLPDFVGDPSQLHQVLVNLVVNAIQAMEGGGTLTIRTRALNGSLQLVVEDTGVGIDEEVIKKIFLPFYTTKDVHEGTGLGLAVVHGIVMAHGGSINVQSKPGGGSRFEVTFPINGGSQTEELQDDGGSQ